MKKKAVILAIAAGLGLSTLLNSSFAEADTLSDLKKDQQKLQEKQSDVKSKINSAEAELQSLKDQQSSVKSELEALDSSIQQTEQEIVNKENEITQKDAEIVQLQEEIKELEDRIKKRDKLLMDRARSLQASGGTVSYLQVLLGSKSFNDFVSRAAAVSTILEADKNIIEEHISDLESVKVKKQQVEDDKKKLEEMKADLESQMASLEEKKEEKDRLLAQLKEQQGEIEEYFMDLQEEQEIIAAQNSAIKKAIELEKKRLEELAKQNNPVVESSGTFMRPAAGRISSEMGARWGTTHFGIDIANASGTPIYAAASGVVSRSYYSSSYGNVIFISHYIDGQVYTTVYAHLSSRGVSAGTVVEKGQQIGTMGTTGQSTGVHLHFELHRGEWNGAKSNAVNPRNYINF